jgi:hypothetical protein
MVGIFDAIKLVAKRSAPTAGLYCAINIGSPRGDHNTKGIEGTNPGLPGNLPDFYP